MVKKILSRPKVVRGSKWFIEYYEYDLETEIEVRHRQDFDLNKIADLSVREEVAQRLLSNLDKFARIKERKPQGPTVSEAVRLVTAVKRKLPRSSSFSTYRTVSNMLLEWLDETKYGKLPLVQFTRKYAIEFWDTVTDRNLRGRTLNNYLTSISALWTVMIDREMVEKNPFDRIKHARVQEKKRRIFTPEERVTVAQWVEKNDYWMFRGILLQFFCYIRPVELCRLKFGHFNLGEGTVRITEDDAKSYRERIVTIPKSIMHYFVDGKFEKYPGNYYLYGMPDNRGRGGGLQPAAKPAAKLRMGKRHGKVLKRLYKFGWLANIDGLSWYSWKDTGITMRLNDHNALLPTRDQAGHEDIKTTMIYRHEEKINPTYRDMPNDLF